MAFHVARGLKRSAEVACGYSKVLSEAKFFKRGGKKRRSHAACKALKKLSEGYHGDHIEHLRAEIEDHHGEIE